MKLILNPKTFQNNFINPTLDAIPSGKTALLIENNQISTYYLNPERTESFYQETTIEDIEDPMDRFNIDLNKLSTGMVCIKTEDSVVFHVDKKELTFKNEAISFKIRTLENEMVPLPAYNPKKQEAYKGIVSEFELPNTVLQDIKHADTFASDSLKMYLFKENDSLYLMFGDKQQSYLDSIKVLVKDNFTASFNERIYRAAFIRRAFKFKNNTLKMRILDNGTLMLIATATNTKTIYSSTPIKQ